jgi:hypothetical protein
MVASHDNLRVFRAGDGAHAHWERVKQRVDVRVAAVVFFCALAAFVVLVQFNADALIQFYYDVNREVNFCDMTELNEYGDYVLQDYLAGERGDADVEAVILGASYTATSDDPRPEWRLHRCLERQMEQATGEDWEIANLASNGFCPWSFFYVTRLLRERRPPDVLVLGLDAVYVNERNRHLILAVGADPREVSFRELCGVLPVNQVPLYASEGNLLNWLRSHIAYFKAFAYMQTSHPKWDTIERWLQFARGRLEGREVELALPGNRSPDGRHKSWSEIHESRVRLERLVEQGDNLSQLTPRRAANLELLGRELRQIQDEGTRVLIVTLPRNPLVPLDVGEIRGQVADWAARYGLEFHDYWTSGLIPDKYFKDTGHFFGEGCEIMAETIKDLLVAKEGRR